MCVRCMGWARACVASRGPSVAARIGRDECGLAWAAEGAAQVGQEAVGRRQGCSLCPELLLAERAVRCAELTRGCVRAEQGVLGAGARVLSAHPPRPRELAPQSRRRPEPCTPGASEDAGQLPADEEGDGHAGGQLQRLPLHSVQGRRVRGCRVTRVTRPPPSLQL
eukprot:624594-Rhodomonas_salina.2